MRKKTGILRIISVGLLLCSSAFLHAKETPKQTESVVTYGDSYEIFHPVFAKHGMVSTADKYATQVGVDILKQGGNAIDAAVAVGFALAVTYPQAGNLGGGGFMVIKKANGDVTTLDFRETAPSKAHRDMFLDKNGNADNQLSLVSPLSSGVPGTVAGFSYAIEKYGSLPLWKLIAPAEKLANEGIIVNNNLASALNIYGREVLLNDSASKTIFFKQNGEPYQLGETLYQKDLAKSLSLIAAQGKDAFYQGDIAKEIIAQMQKSGGLITESDLANYRVIERQPIHGTYRGYDVYSMPLPSSGGVHIIQILNILENFDLKSFGQNSAKTIHTLAESMKYAYADRSEYLGDPAFVKAPVEMLTSKDYATRIAKSISFEKARPSTEIKPGILMPYESDQTTHYSVIDQFGNAVAVTYTLNTNFGNGIIAGKSGILLNNEMDDFSAKPGAVNMYGLTGDEANSIAPNKRPLSSMSPTIITKDGQLVLVTGSPGGSRIITTVLQIILNVLDFDMNIAEATNAPRIHHQWFPDEIRIEKGLNIDTINVLKTLGHRVSVKTTMGSTQSIFVTKDGFYGAADPRTENDLVAGF